MKKGPPEHLATAIEALGEALKDVCVKLALLLRHRELEKPAPQLERVLLPRRAIALEAARRQLLTVKQFVQAYPAFTEGSVRWLIFNEKWNRFDEVVVRVGHRVLIDADRVEQWLELPAQERRSMPRH